MSDIWSRAWCETQRIPNFALKGKLAKMLRFYNWNQIQLPYVSGMTPSNEVRDSPNYIPRVNSNPTQYGSIYDNSRSSSPEAKEILCFQFRKKVLKKPRTPDCNWARFLPELFLLVLRVNSGDPYILSLSVWINLFTISWVNMSDAPHIYWDATQLLGLRVWF